VFTIAGRDPLIEIAKALQDAALNDEYFVSRWESGKPACRFAWVI
jgi:hypothetical protein